MIGLAPGIVKTTAVACILRLATANPIHNVLKRKIRALTVMVFLLELTAVLDDLLLPLAYSATAIKQFEASFQITLYVRFIVLHPVILLQSLYI